MTDAELIRWPALSDDLTDSGEGGLFAMAVWPAAWPEQDQPGFEQCMVDVYPTIGQGDVLVNPGDARQVYESLHVGYVPPPAADQDSDAYQAWEHRRREARESLPLHAAVHLGSTGCSLWSEHAGEYHRVGRDDLTDRGRQVVDALDAAYGTRAVLLTFLDT